ncbi:MAG TPA: type II secretion system protein GspC [Polyangia bacterium]|jgi:general secretion pathway protein C
MELVLRRYLWVVDLIGIAIGAVLAGDAAATLIAAALPPPGAALSARRAQPPPRASIVAVGKPIDGIVGRNIFCSACGDAPAAPEPERSRRPLRLLAIMFAPPPFDPGWSLAIVRDDAAGTTGAYGVGDRVGDAAVREIQDVRVLLDVGRGRRELLELLARRPGEPPERRLPADESFDGVRQIGAHSYEVRRAVVDRFLGGGITPPWPRVVPQTRDGAPAGFLLTGVRGNSPFAALGLANGDLLRAVNGQSLATPEAALAALSTLRAASQLALLIERDGRVVRLDYVIR